MNPKTEKSRQTWRDKLEALLAESRAAAQNDDFNLRIKVAEKLQDFIVENPLSQPTEPETAEFDEMDKIARNAHDALLLDSLGERVAAIVSQSAELAGLTKKVQTQTAANEQAAKSLRLEKVQKVVVAVTGTIGAIQDLKAQLENLSATEEGAAALTKSLAEAIQTLQDLRTQVESTG